MLGPWFLILLLLVMALYLAGLSWFNYRRLRHQGGATWRVVPALWVASSFLSGAAFLVAVGIVYDGLPPRPAKYYFFGACAACMLVGVAGGVVHGLVLRRWQRRPHVDPDYADDPAGNPARSDGSGVGPPQR
ncbi:MAG TPA: hypothetical protein VKE40_21680 [Gemmataceae bacterium]|nr:hypothetical protein [Gemmataceae bacterium]